MKNKIIKVLFLSIFFTASTYAAVVDLKIDEVTQNWANSLNVNFDKDVNWTTISWDIKIFRDLEITEISKDETMPNKLNLKLSKDIKVGGTYNVFWVFWVDWSADFIVENWNSVKMLSKAPTSQWIVRVAFKDGKTMELYFKDPLTWNDYEFKLLEEFAISDLTTLSWNLIINTVNSLVSDSDYIIMIISLSDELSNEYNIDESIFDFRLWEVSIKKEDIQNEIMDTLKTVEEEKVVQEEVNNNQEISQTWTVQSESWALEWNVEQVAKKITETPDTWAETWILILLTLIISSIYFLARRTA